MKTETLKKELSRKCKCLGITLVGFVPVERWSSPPKELPNILSSWIPKEFWPQSIYPETKTVIVIGLPVPLPIVETAPSIYYHELYKTINAMLDSKAYEIANFLTEKGHGAIYLPRDAYGDVEILIEKPFAFFSHKHAAYLAGMGSFGHNNVLLTSQYGPRVRFTSIFTTAEIPASTIEIKDMCTRCLLCAIRSKQLRDEYRSPCGICIKVCPVGEDRKLFGRKNMSIYSKDKKFEKYHKAWEHVRKYGSKT